MKPSRPLNSSNFKNTCSKLETEGAPNYKSENCIDRITTKFNLKAKTPPK